MSHVDRSSASLSFSNPKTNPSTYAQTNYAFNAYAITSKRELITYLHQCLFCPPKKTLLAAIKNNQLT